MSRATSRYSSIPRCNFPLSIVGVGATGHALARMAASSRLFASHLLYDDDVISVENLGPQLWCEKDLGELKTTTTMNEMWELYSDARIISFPHRVVPGTSLSRHVFSCVDSMHGRRCCFEGWLDVLSKPDETPIDPPFFIDPRIGGETVEIYVVRPTDDPQLYLETLCDDSEASALPCTLRMTPHSAGFAASVSFAAATGILRGLPVPFHRAWYLPTLTTLETECSPSNSESPTPQVAACES